ncbi:Asp-tRNA(Asn)/Glu-tRNA(Gln) amidotransferase subunit GatC [Pisciglobus halotolerans]|uniref:Aspartyl/glutamyl-tRNA(Asn/Gln) amidotransferase subunit C n=1 Tax=Pisciglobus halotolerans TaxID=745365 RepID=A0A1I3C5P0_9LACT|nr:Asp-tRNA(Asn)/Glu-tRNA(Gln) amidotransferase subunit GatC [Pisciglobus halotolerans]SFH69311.1 aspartyl/glutamyl-tRNA(Asn/Gln) amidotransferase subunit C [Pisciglobus halotolerans]
MTVNVNEQDIRHVAKLAKLEISDDEIKKFTVQMDNIIDMVEQLDTLDTKDVPEMYHGAFIENVMREDKAVPGTDREALFENVKESKDGLIRVPAIIDNGEGDA